jgi:hypothetical protein
MERGSRKKPSSAESEKMDRPGDIQKKMEGHCSTGRSPQRAVMPMEEEEEEEKGGEEASLPHSKVTATYPYTELARSSSYSPYPTYLRFILILSSHLRLGLPNGLFP